MAESDVSALAISVVTEGFRDVHGRIRELISGMDESALNWRPHPEANSIAAMVAHVLGSEREMLAAVRAVRVARDRPAEFRVHATARELIALVDQADAWLDEQVAQMAARDLEEDRPRGDRPLRPGLFWLVTIYGHAREHLAQMELTKQLYGALR